MLHCLQFGPDLLNERQEGGIDEENGILRVVDDVSDLLGKESGIDGVNDRPAARDGVIEFVMAVRVPGERGDAVLMLYTEPDQRIGELARAGGCLCIVVTPEAPSGNRLTIPLCP